MPKRRPAGPGTLVCPACRNQPLTLLTVPSSSALQLDHCRKCGGVWFDEGEVGELRKARSPSFLTTVQVPESARLLPCAECRQPYQRNVKACPNCRTENRILCPVCRRHLEIVAHGTTRVDVCLHCRGMWFDNVELGDIWNIEVTEFQKRQRKRRTPMKEITARRADHFDLIDVLVLSDPRVIEGSGHLVTGAAELIGDAPAVAAAAFEGIGAVAEGAIEATGELAGNVFEAIGAIIASLLD